MSTNSPRPMLATGSRLPAPEPATVQVCLSRIGDGQKYIDVTGGVFTGIRAERDTRILLIDHYGRIVDE